MILFLKRSWPFLVLAILSFTIHFAFLSHPSQVVFDEVHFGKFVAAYSTGQYYFDIHPPLGKLMIAGFAKLASVNPVFDFEKIGEILPTDTLLALRFLPAFFGALFVLFFSWLAYLISRSKHTALIAGFLVLLDNAFLVQSKFILVDIFLLYFEILALCCFFLWQQQAKFSAKWFTYLALTGVFAGLTISVKWTGLAVIGIMEVILLAKIFSKKLALYLSSPATCHSDPANAGEESLARLAEAVAKRANAGRHKVGDTSRKATWSPRDFTSAYGLGMTKLNLFKESFTGSIFLLIIAFIVYLLPFFLHFQLLPNSGPGDAFMSQPFQQELKYGHNNVYQPLNFWQKFTELNKTMYTANANLTAEHPFGSRWYNWPINSKPVYYWNQASANNPSTQPAKIYLSGNFMLWWLAGLSLIFTLLATATKNSRRWLSPAAYILLLGYFANLLPFIFVNRVAFLYHYLPTIMYGILLLSLWLTKLWLKENVIFSIIIGLVLLGFISLSPLSYGWSLSPQLDQIENKLINIFH